MKCVVNSKRNSQGVVGGSKRGGGVGEFKGGWGKEGKRYVGEGNEKGC